MQKVQVDVEITNELLQHADMVAVARHGIVVVQKDRWGTSPAVLTPQQFAERLQKEGRPPMQKVVLLATRCKELSGWPDGWD